MIKICCDFCERPLDVQKTDLGEFHMLSVTKEVYTKDLYPHLCKSCATKIDEIIQRHKNDVTNKQILAEKFAKINKERREKLNSKG